MDAQTFTVKTPQITDGRSHMPLVRTDVLMSGLNYYAPGRKNKLHTHPGEDHMFVVLDGQATFFDKDQKAYGAGEGRRHPSSGRALLPVRELRRHAVGVAALRRLQARPKRRPASRRLRGATSRTDDEMDYICVDGDPIDGQEWTLT